jgi:hypothetical protein
MPGIYVPWVGDTLLRSQDSRSHQAEAFLKQWQDLLPESSRDLANLTLLKVIDLQYHFPRWKEADLLIGLVHGDRRRKHYHQGELAPEDMNEKELPSSRPRQAGKTVSVICCH